MKVTKEFIKLGVASNTLNKAQCQILGLEFPLTVTIDEVEVDKELSLKETNLFLFLRGKLALKAQEQIIKNYDLVANFHKKKSSEPKEEEIKKDNEVIIYCDGACKGNPGEAGSGLAIYEDNNKPILLYGEYEKRGTNNTAELKALYKALLIASEHKRASIYSDSKYSIDCIRNWAYSWKKNGWSRKGGEIKNLDIIKLSHSLYDKIKDRVSVEYIKGHAGFEGNELADRMAGLAIIEKNHEYKEYIFKNIDTVLKIR